MTSAVWDRREVLNIAGGFVAAGLITMLAFATWALIYREVPGPNRDALMVVIGILSMNVGQIVAFFFGSSQTNKKQAETIETLAKTAQTAGAALSPHADANVTLDPGQSAKVSASEQVP